MSSKKEKFGGLDGLQDFDGDDLDGGMRGMLGEGEKDREWDDSFREPDQKIFLRVPFKSSSVILFSELHKASFLLKVFLFQTSLSANSNGAISSVSTSLSSSVITSLSSSCSAVACISECEEIQSEKVNEEEEEEEGDAVRNVVDVFAEEVDEGNGEWIELDD
ncbi:uncharacterized protein MONOS_10671 [Monocercomonoides exilis]|uniref:uncharacterized protein n=1 Tax=Monocercomonoides exilis TaxID=2049356 RepID=UPI003559DBD3|nr:hypothetical protein MONOS_10671 [Monocercomonoides exilis]|eukprot:MONOS_10671.1-p1 / transcript=MONOS_10671.1 / gene=MONOS_10671 / organism=Monocercomonoides_exilis_PA203 / gene_product=unspecified product / transcript_product=unspecified product / location=Mono_scaffold00493:36357-37111(+) / protein_length=163 / sequence_SO=supercontig / SO=protein_coding / is_pseudo=false